MSRIKELIQEHCPNGVEYRTIEQVCRIEKGKQLNRENLLEQGEYPVYNGGINPSGYWNESNFPANRIAISQGGASAGYVNFVKTEFWAGAHCFVLEPIGCNLDYRFFYHCVKNSQDALMESKEGAGIPGLSKKKLAAFEIPVPPIEAQREIVRILDAMCELEAKLQEELESREKQLEKVRIEMLRSTTGKRLTLKDVAKIKNGKDYKHLTPGSYPVYGSGGVMAYVSEFVFDKPSVLLPRKGSLQNVFYVEGPFWNIDTIFYTEINEKLILPKYFYNVIADEHIENLCTSDAARPSLTQSVLNKIEIPVPPIETQREIVAKLDAFEALIKSLRDEIDARHAQYEHYRDTLLAFDKAA